MAENVSRDHNARRCVEEATRKFGVECKDQE